MSAIKELQAGENAPLSDTSITVGFSWEVPPSNGPRLDPTVAAILTDPKGKALTPEDFVFFNQMTSAEGGQSVKYILGEDKDQVDIDTTRIPESVAKIVFIVFLNPTENTQGVLSGVRDMSIRVLNSRGEPILSHAVQTADMVTSKAVWCGEIYRNNGAWKFRAKTQGFSGGAKEILTKFGIEM